MGKIMAEAGKAAMRGWEKRQRVRQPTSSPEERITMSQGHRFWMSATGLNQLNANSFAADS
ncbi:predicted protein [Uncinocarpus reesii 1704]|uniref:Uncharacterized protein n=1 Tax=Uncinocarpus reesii (strain UAMH 1704) TaxID=336963 RepID=C4JHL7_UNCRE|nr:uncharacterized protein UREG_01380 [Uncinocarpus reesii 1704]EEP76531.1 predicted protein [Uncinocarpus reesii 1704]